MNNVTRAVLRTPAFAQLNGCADGNQSLVKCKDVGETLSDGNPCSSRGGQVYAVVDHDVL